MDDLSAWIIRGGLGIVSSMAIEARARLLADIDPSLPPAVTDEHRRKAHAILRAELCPYREEMHPAQMATVRAIDAWMQGQA